MGKDEEWISFSNADSNGAFRKAYDRFEKRNTIFQQKENHDDIRKRLINYQRPENVCESDKHDFVRIDEFTGGIKYKCKKCGLEASSLVLSGEFDKAFFGSFIDGHSYKWHSDYMDADKIEKFSLSFGDCPIRTVTYEKGKLTYKNSINGSRDGWMPLPEDSFEPHSIILNSKQIETILYYLKEIEISTWETDLHIFNNVGACGFCLHNTFECVFENNRSFICNSPGQYTGFNRLTTLLSKLCGFAPIVFITDSGDSEEMIECCGYKYPREVLYCRACGKKLRNTFVAQGSKKVKVVVTDCCSIHIQEKSSYCPKCGKKIANKEQLIHLEIDYDPEETSWLCECLHSNACEHQYCSNCGKKRPF